MIKTEQDKIKDFHRSGAGGREVVQAHTSLIDSVIYYLVEELVTSRQKPSSHTLLEDFSIIAVGGYGRGELNPCSDIDLLFLTSKKFVVRAICLFRILFPFYGTLDWKLGQAVVPCKNVYSWPEKMLQQKHP